MERMVGGACMRHILIMSRIRGVVNYDVSHKCFFFLFLTTTKEKLLTHH